jgi:hypothetical protein
MLTASYLYLLCQAFDIRALQADFNHALVPIVEQELFAHFGERLRGRKFPVCQDILKSMFRTLDSTSTMDVASRMMQVAGAAVPILVDYLATDAFADPSALSAIPAFRASVASRATDLLVSLRKEFLSGARGPAPASNYLSGTRPIYEFVRLTLDIRMHGSENESVFANGLGVEDVTVGQNVSLIYEVRCLHMDKSNEIRLTVSHRRSVTVKCKPLSQTFLREILPCPTIDYLFVLCVLGQNNILRLILYRTTATLVPCNLVTIATVSLYTFPQ